MVSIRTAYTVSMESTVNDVWNLLTMYNETFIFVTDPISNEIVAYIKSNDILPLLEEKQGRLKPIAQLPLRTDIMFVQKKADSLDFFKVFAEEVIVIVNEAGQFEGYLQREDVLFHLLTIKSSDTDWIRSLLKSIPMGIIITDSYGRLENFNSEVLRMLKLSPEELKASKIPELLDLEAFTKVVDSGDNVLNHLVINERFGVLVDFGPIRNQAGTITGVIIVVQDLPDIEKMAMELEYVNNLNVDLQAILSTIYDQILVVNDKGTLLRASGTLIKDFWDSQADLSIGLNLMELEHEGTFFSGIVKRVIARGKKVSVTQESEAGKTVLAVGNPVFNEKNELERIVIALRDITETLQLKEELRHAKKVTLRYKKELEDLRKRSETFSTKKLIYASEKIDRIMKYIRKISNVSSTVLITGESGVGKEVFAREIHEISPRNDKPFIKVNCGAIPESLLESELFGYTKGAFTGANTNGKPGYFQLAHKGILFLDEIGELPLNLQVKLLRVLQEREIMPVGGTEIVKVDVQIIAATNLNLEEMVEKKLFREDLYYRLHVLPVQIPPLRERPEDIPLLSLHFLQIFNEKYDRKTSLSQDALDLLESYSWPGNVRELQNIIERLAVTADEDLIGSEQVLPLLKKGKKGLNNKRPIKMAPLKEALRTVEENLIKQAMEIYKTTSEAAKILGVSQSTISRKYMEIREREQRGEKIGS